MKTLNKILSEHNVELMFCAGDGLNGNSGFKEFQSDLEQLIERAHKKGYKSAVSDSEDYDWDEEQMSNDNWEENKKEFLG